VFCSTWTGSWLGLWSAMPVLVFITRYFNARCKWLLRTYETNFKHEFLRARTRNWNEDFTVV
jgi:hypothetical protein